MPSAAEIGHSKISDRSNWAFFAGCGVVFAALAASLPAYSPVLQPDSGGYLEFSASRTSLYPMFLALCRAIGLDLDGILAVQIALFSVALIVLLAAMARAGAPRWMLAAFTLVLGASSYFSTFQRTILTEGLFSTLLVLTLAFWIDYLRTGHARALAWSALFVSLGVGVRPAGAALVPMLFVALWLRWRQRDRPRWVMLAALIIPLSAGTALERGLYRWQHGASTESLSRYLWMGKAAMVIDPGTKFRGPHVAALTRLGAALNRDFAPVQTYLAGAPVLARPALAANYEGVAQFQILNSEVTREAKELGVTEEALVSEFGKQVLAGNLLRYLRLSFTHYVGQWSVASLNFPPTARAVLAHSIDPPYAGKMSDLVLHPQPKLSSWVVYPGFLLAGIVTLVLSLLLLWMIFRPPPQTARGQLLLYVAFFAAACQGYTIFLSLVNVSTPRFLLAYYPALVLVGVFLAMTAGPASWRFGDTALRPGTGVDKTL